MIQGPGLPHHNVLSAGRPSETSIVTEESLSTVREELGQGEGADLSLAARHCDVLQSSGYHLQVGSLGLDPVLKLEIDLVRKQKYYSTLEVLIT